MGKTSLITLILFALFLVSGCDVYNTLYVNEDGVEVPDAEIVVEEDEETDEEEVSEEEVEVEAEEESEETGLEEVTGEVVSEEMEEEVVEEVEVSVDEAESDAAVVLIEETEQVSLLPQAEDPDNDVLRFTFTSPLDNNGEWQTTYGDAGEYTVTVTASDGDLSASQEVLIVVSKKEEAPTLDGFAPSVTAVELGETESVAFEVDASDLNNDPLTYSWKLDGVEVGDEENYEYQTTYDDAGSHTVKVTVNDGVFDTERIWAVTVSNLNRQPIVEAVDDIAVDETDTVVIELNANDLDGDVLVFSIDDERFEQDENTFIWETSFDDAGEHLVSLSASDGEDTTSIDVAITVDNVNRAPVILDIVQK